MIVATKARKRASQKKIQRLSGGVLKIGGDRGGGRQQLLAVDTRPRFLDALRMRQIPLGGNEKGVQKRKRPAN